RTAPPRRGLSIRASAAPAAGRKARGRSRVLGSAAAPWRLEPVEAEGFPPGELARGAKRGEALEQPPAGAIAQGRDRRRGGNRVVVEQCLQRPPLPLGAQFRAYVHEPPGAARQVLGQVEGGERRAGVAQRRKLGPTRLARAHPPPLARPTQTLAGEQRRRDRPIQVFG